jgi:hypothetical protein
MASFWRAPPGQSLSKTRALMSTSFAKPLLIAALVSLSPCTAVLAQSSSEPPAAGSVNFDKALNEENNWYFSWGYSRQQYQDSDIHISQPSQGNDFTLHGVKGSDFPTSVSDTLKSLTELDLTNPQENIRIGKFMNPEKTFAIEFSLDHSKYNVDSNQTLPVSGTIGGAPAPASLKTPGQFDYALHNGLNHLMLNAVWLKHLAGPEQKPGDLQLISRAGAGILLPHAENTILGNTVQVGPKNDNVCCFNKGDWWQVNGWTAGVEVGLRYTVYKTIFLELTSKWAYGQLRGVPVYQGSADQTLIMTEQVLSTGFLF